jgi:hypothetical protein
MVSHECFLLYVPHAQRTTLDGSCERDLKSLLTANSPTPLSPCLFLLYASTLCYVASSPTVRYQMAYHKHLNQVNDRPGLIFLGSFFCFTTILAVTLRFSARRLLRVGYGPDDWLALVSMVRMLSIPSKVWYLTQLIRFSCWR